MALQNSVIELLRDEVKSIDTTTPLHPDPLLEGRKCTGLWGPVKPLPAQLSLAGFRILEAGKHLLYLSDASVSQSKSNLTSL